MGRKSLCGKYANQVDHINRGDDHSPENLQALCEFHHAKKSSAEGAEAYHKTRREISAKFRHSEAHPGLL